MGLALAINVPFPASQSSIWLIRDPWIRRLHNGPFATAVASDRVRRSEVEAGAFNLPHNWKEPYRNTRL
jgi:hypothetical protein